MSLFVWCSPQLYSSSQTVACSFGLSRQVSLYPYGGNLWCFVSWQFRHLEWALKCLQESRFDLWCSWQISRNRAQIQRRQREQKQDEVSSGVTSEEMYPGESGMSLLPQRSLPHLLCSEVVTDAWLPPIHTETGSVATITFVRAESHGRTFIYRHTDKLFLHSNLTLLCFSRLSHKSFFFLWDSVCFNTHIVTPVVVFSLWIQFLVSQLCLRSQPHQIQACGAAVTCSDKHRHALLFAHHPRTTIDCTLVLSETNCFSRTVSLMSARSCLNM